jgi:uncharacterized membrane protein
MSALVIGLVVFLGAHSLRLFADGWRSATIVRIGEKRWKALHAIVSLTGFGLILWGFGQARADSALLWLPPVWTRHAAALLTLPAFILLIAAHVPKNSLRDAVGHPLVASVALWAAAHLLANGRGVDVLLFGGFFVWAIADYVSLRRRDRAAGVVRRGGTLRNALLAAVAGIVAWAAMAFFAHRWLFGVAPFA